MFDHIEAYLTLEYLLPVITAFFIVAAVSRYIRRKEEYADELSPFAAAYYGKPKIKSKVTFPKAFASWILLSAAFLTVHYFAALA